MLAIILILLGIIYSDITEEFPCPLGQPIPIEVSGSSPICQNNICTKDQLDFKACSIGNKKSKLRYLNSIVVLPDKKNNYKYYANVPGNDLIIETTNETSSEKYLYCLKTSDGRGCYYDQDILKDVESKKFISNTQVAKNIARIVEDIEGEKYYISFNGVNLEIFEFSNFTKYYSTVLPISGIDSEYNELFQLSQTSFIYSYLRGERLKFLEVNCDLNGTYTSCSTSAEIDEGIIYSKAKLNPCTMTDSKKIVCIGYKKESTTEKFIIRVYNGVVSLSYEKLEQNTDVSHSITDNYFYHKCYHWIGEIVLCAYYNGYKHFKLFFINVNNDGTFSKFEFGMSDGGEIDNFYDMEYDRNEIFIISSSKFALFVNNVDRQFFVMETFEIYGESRIKRRRYSINYFTQDLRINSKFTGISFGSYYGIIVSGNYPSGDTKEKTILLIFSYPGGEDFVLSEAFKFEPVFRFKPTDIITIQNNIFGYELVRVSFYNISNLEEGGVALKDYGSDELIKEESIVGANSDLKLCHKNITQGFLAGKYSFFIQGTAESPTTNTIWDSYADSGYTSDTLNEYDSFYQKEEVKGKMLKMTINVECSKNCERCFFKGNSSYEACVICEENYTAEYYNERTYGKCIRDICPEETPYLNIEFQDCVEFCPYDYLKNSTCMISKICEKSLNETFLELKKVFVNVSNNNTNEILIHGINIKHHVTNYVTNLTNEVDNEVARVDLSECEYINNLISEGTPLVLIEIERNYSAASYKNYSDVEFEIYNHNTGQEVDVYTNCKYYYLEKKIKLNLPGIKQKYKRLKEKGVDLFDPLGYFYVDFCKPFKTEYNTDLTLELRKSIYYDPTIPLCGVGCTYNNYFPDKDIVRCKCNINKDFIYESELENHTKIEIEPKTTPFDKIGNLYVLYCLNDYFTAKELKENTVSLVLFSFTGLQIIFSILTFVKGIKDINKIMQKLINDKKEKKEKNSKPKKNGGENIENVQGPPRKINELMQKKLGTEKKTEDINEIEYAKRMRNAMRKFPGSEKSSGADSRAGLKYGNKPFNDYNRHNEGTQPVIHKKGPSKRQDLEEDIRDEILQIKAERKERKIKEEIIKSYTDYEINKISYDEALKFDIRDKQRYFYSALKVKHLIFFSFFSYHDYNVFFAKFNYFIVSMNLYITSNVAFFTKSKINNIYDEQGQQLFKSNALQVILSTLITIAISLLLKQLILSDKAIIEIQNQKNYENALNLQKNAKKKILRNLIIFSIIGFILTLFTWFYFSCFSVAFENTKIYCLKNIGFSILIGLGVPIITNIIGSYMRIKAIIEKNHPKLYKFSQIINYI